jgi:hypothetical protein
MPAGGLPNRRRNPRLKALSNAGAAIVYSTRVMDAYAAHDKIA